MLAGVESSSNSDVIWGVDEPIVARGCNNAHARTGISFPAADLTWRSVLYANSCSRIPVLLGQVGLQTVRICPSPAPDSCECLVSSAEE